jgi:hypothetical protein
LTERPAADPRQIHQEDRKNFRSFLSKRSNDREREKLEPYPPHEKTTRGQPATGGLSVFLYFSEYKARDQRETRQLFMISGKIQPGGPRRQEKRIQKQKPLQDLTEEAKKQGKPDKKPPNRNTLPYHTKTERPTHSKNRTTTRRKEASLHDFRDVLHTRSVLTPLSCYLPALNKIQPRAADTRATR